MQTTQAIPARLNRDHSRLGDHHEDVVDASGEVHAELIAIAGRLIDPSWNVRPLNDVAWSVDFGAGPIPIIAYSDGRLVFL